MSYSNVPPPDSLSGRPSRSQIDDRRKDDEKVKEYNKLTKGYNVPKDMDDEEYFNASDDEQQGSGNKSGANQESDEDELDAFMSGINEQAKKDVDTSKRKGVQAITTGETSGGRGGRDDIEKEDAHEAYLTFLEEYKERHVDAPEDNYQYDEDGNIIWTWKKVIDPLPSIDHSTIKYPKFVSNCYTQHPDIEKLTSMEVFELRNALDIRVFGSDPPKPCASFGHFGFEQKIISRLQKSEFEKPTPIQAQAIPAALSGRDVLGLAATGSGKTLAYVLPAIVHINSQPEYRVDSIGPFVVIIVPTRELGIQVYEQARYYSTPFGFSVVRAIGGENKYEQQKALESGCDICVCTPGRMIDLIKINATDFVRTSFLVFDEADRMFDLGFEAQVRSLSDHVRSDRQTLMFSATFQPKIEKLASYALSNPVKILCGEVGVANTDVVQMVRILPNLDSKFNWLFTHLVEFCTMGKVLIFVTKKADSEIVAEKLRTRSFQLSLLHGDMLQVERSERLNLFRTTVPILVATDVAARGLDITDIRTIVNFDVARDSDTHVHRIGRTGRAGHKGIAYTLLTEADKEFAGPLMKILENSGQEVPKELVDIAKKSKWYAENANKTNNFNPRSHTGLGFVDKKKHHSIISDPAALLAKPSTSKPQVTNVSKAIEKARNVADSSTGVELSRYDTMRKVLKASFKGTFTKAESDDNPRSTFTDPTPLTKLPRSNEPPEKKRKSRWNT